MKRELRIKLGQGSIVFVYSLMVFGIWYWIFQY
jgi:hypothetical protein